MRWLVVSLTSCLVLGLLSGCPKRDTGEIDVDSIQGQVDAVGDHLKSMRLALKKKDLDEAEEQYEEAAEIMKDNRAALEAYPEIGLVKDRMREGDSDLCYGFVSINLSFFFRAIKNRDPEEAGDKLELSNKELKRCLKKIGERDDFLALKMNLESAPQALADLVKQLEIEDRLRRIREFREDQASDIRSIREDMASLEKRPNQRKKAQNVDGDIKDIRASLKGKKDFEKAKKWRAYVKATLKLLDKLEFRREALVRRGILHWLVEDSLPEASKLASEGFNAKKRDDALKPTKKAYQGFAQCEQLVAQVIREEPALIRYVLPWKGAKKTVRWLKQHCATSRRLAGQMLSKLTGRKVLPPKLPAMKPPKPKSRTPKKAVKKKPPKKKPPQKKPPPPKEEPKKADKKKKRKKF